MKSNEYYAKINKAVSLENLQSNLCKKKGLL